MAVGKYFILLTLIGVVALVCIPLSHLWGSWVWLFLIGFSVVPVFLMINWGWSDYLYKKNGWAK